MYRIAPSNGAVCGNCAAIQMVGLNPFARSLPLWLSVVTSRRAVGAIRDARSPCRKAIRIMVSSR